MASHVTKIVTALAFVSIFACSKFRGGRFDAPSEGELITAKFLTDYSGTFQESEFGERYEIAPNGGVRIKNVRQVGREGTDVPYPTLCTYFSEGRITHVYNRSDERKRQYMDYATHLIKISVDKIYLDPSESAKQEPLVNCQKYVANSKAQKLTTYAELISADSFRVHTSGGGDYKVGQKRTDSTLDEVFTRLK